MPAHATTDAITGRPEVVDGDGLVIGPIRIRLHGIDAPELGQRCTESRGGTWGCDEAAAERLEALAGTSPASRWTTIPTAGLSPAVPRGTSTSLKFWSRQVWFERSDATPTTMSLLKTKPGQRVWASGRRRRSRRGIFGQIVGNEPPRPLPQGARSRATSAPRASGSTTRHGPPGTPAPRSTRPTANAGSATKLPLSPQVGEQRGLGDTNLQPGPSPG